MLQRQWSMCVYLGCINWTISLALDEQLVRLHSHVFDFEVVLGTWSSVRAWFHTQSLSKYIAMAMMGVRLSWLHRSNDLVDPGRAESTFVCWCACFPRCKPVYGHNFTLMSVAKTYCNDMGLRLSGMDWFRWFWGKACACSTLKLLFRLDPAWGDSLTLIPCHNILRFRWSVHIYLGWIDGTISYEQFVRFWVCVLDFGRIIV